MSRKNQDPNRRFHDRVARRYDLVYDDPFWEFHDRITHNHLKHFLPKNTAAQVADLGTGTGKWGLKLLKQGYPTTFVDLSRGMLEEVEKKLAAWREQPDLAAKAARAKVVLADVIDLRELPADAFELVTAFGDVVSLCTNPGRCLSEVHRLLKPGGIFVFTVDNHLAAIDHFIDSGNLNELEAFVRTGKTEWLAHNASERFPVTMFTPGQIESLVKSRGFETLSRIGKMIIPARMNRKLFEREDAIERLVDLETQLQKDPAAYARASHIQLAVKKL